MVSPYLDVSLATVYRLFTVLSTPFQLKADIGDYENEESLNEIKFANRHVYKNLVYSVNNEGTTQETIVSITFYLPGYPQKWVSDQEEADVRSSCLGRHASILLSLCMAF